MGVSGERDYDTLPVDSRNRDRSQKFSFEMIYRMVLFFFLSASKQKTFFSKIRDKCTVSRASPLEGAFILNCIIYGTILFI